MPGIIGYGNALISASLLDDIVRQALGSTSDHIFVHAVRAGSYDASESGGTEFQVHIEPFLYLVVIIRNGPELRLCLLVKIRISEPLLVDTSVISHK